MTTPICPRLLNMINDFVLLRFRARTPEDLSAIEVIYLLLLLYSQKHHKNYNRCYKNYPMKVGKWAEGQWRPDRVDRVDKV